MTVKAILVGSQDRSLEGLLRACGAHTSQASPDDLASLAQPSTPQPHLIVLDLRRRPVVPPALALLKRQHPSTGVIIVASKPDPDLMLSAMRAGVNDYLMEPLTHDAVEAAVRNVMARTEVAARQIFAFVGAKGGVGTTALAVNVATTLADIATSGALLVDLHATHGDAALYLGVEPRFSFVDALQNIHKLDEAYFRTLVTRGPGRVKLLAAPDVPDPARLDAHSVRALLEFASRQFEYLVVDVPYTESGALEALSIAKSIIVVTTQELPAVSAATKLAARLRQQHGADRVLVVVSRHDKQSDITPRDLERALGGALAFSFPSDYRLTMAALNKGRPVVLDNHSKLAGSVKSFTQRLAGQAAGDEPGQAAAGWLGWLAKRK